MHVTFGKHLNIFQNICMLSNFVFFQHVLHRWHQLV
jgi:hypothetical protein